MRRAMIAAALLLGSTAAVAADPSYSIAIRDHQFVAAELPAQPGVSANLPAQQAASFDLPVQQGVRFELTIRNDQSVPAEFESSSLHREKVIPPGTSASIFVGPLRPGRYEFFDDFHPATRGFLVAQ